MYTAPIAGYQLAFAFRLRIGIAILMLLLVTGGSSMGQATTSAESERVNIIQVESSGLKVTPKVEAQDPAQRFFSGEGTGESAAGIDQLKKERFFPPADPSAASVTRKVDPPANKADGDPPVLDESFQWGSAIKQSLLFLSIQHAYAVTQPKTREALKGKFFKDYSASVKSLHGWDDGGRFFTNYIAHPLQGSFMGFIQVQNDPKGRKQRFGKSADYWRSRMKAMAWSAAWSTQFEIGPVSQASIGNVGLNGKQTWIDIVVTPTVGTAFLVTEDAIDRYLIERIERYSNNYYLMAFARMLLNPTRTMANVIRFKLPWYRDRKRVY